MRITRCICADRTFASLLYEARQTGQSLEAVCEDCGATHGCEMCKPYLEQAAATGQTEFHECLPAPSLDPDQQDKRR